jgi:hypothetical protein
VDEYFDEHGIGMMLHRLDYTGRIGIYHMGMQRSQSTSLTEREQIRDAA